ncbi:MAG: zinc metallopeptidase [Bacilli bacterium]|nr:zinc metallopeptidase [Bacilli bacterium]
MDFFIVYGLTFISLIITLGAQLFVNGSYSKYKKVRNQKGITGREAAREILDRNGLNDVKVVETRGTLSDHYDPRSRAVALSSEIYHGTSVAGISVAAHECGHAIQDKDGYFFMRIRASLIPIVNFSSYAGYIAIVIGFAFGALNLVWLGILFEIAILLFQIITLPVELNASSRALKLVKEYNFFTSRELGQGKVMLSAAAMTYVASVASTLIQILRLVLMIGRRND